MIIHRVSAGETLATIAVKYSTGTAIIERDNGAGCIYEGARLMIRTGVKLHVVRPFQRLDVIAHEYGVSVESILHENRMVSPAVYAGQQLIIPDKSL